MTPATMARLQVIRRFRMPYFYRISLYDGRPCHTSTTHRPSVMLMNGALRHGHHPTRAPNAYTGFPVPGCRLSSRTVP